MKSIFVFVSILFILGSCSKNYKKGDPFQHLEVFSCRDSFDTECKKNLLQRVAYPTQPGKYYLEDWEYIYRISSKTTRSEKRLGVLKFKNKPITGANTQIKETPFGRLMFYSMNGYNSGWLNTLTYDKRVFRK